jgi:hypothetical protein
MLLKLTVKVISEHQPAKEIANIWKRMFLEEGIV